MIPLEILINSMQPKITVGNFCVRKNYVILVDKETPLRTPKVIKPANLTIGY